MKWTRASERLPEDPNDTYVIRKLHDYGIWFGRDIIKMDYKDTLLWLDESDESPESSVWPGDGQPFENYPALAEVIQTIATNGLNSGSLWNKLLFEINNALQSRTAVKAEGIIMKPEDEEESQNIIEYWENKFNKWCEDYDKLHKLFIEHNPQPTAGGVKEPFLMDQQQFQELSHEEKEEYRSQFKSQLSPSNPIIKRPTEEEIDKAGYLWIYNHYGHSQTEIWEAAINWLLSIQPDK